MRRGSCGIERSGRPHGAGHRRPRAARRLARQGAARAPCPRGRRSAATSRPHRRSRCSASRRASTSSTATSATTGLVGRALNEYEVDSVFHLAAQTLVGTANRAPLSTFETNVRGTWLLLEACAPARSRERDRGLLGQGLRTPPRAALHRGPGADPDVPVRRLEGGRRPDRALLLAHVRAAGRGDPVRQPLRRRRHEPLAAGARGDRRGARRPAAGGPLRRLARARLPVRRGRRRAPTWRSGGRCWTAAGRGRRSTPAAGGRTASATSSS